MRSRLEDLISTAERQLASRSYDAAIDTCRTALTEPGAGEAGVEALLESACRSRDEARGVVPPPAEPPPTSVQAIETIVEVAPQPVAEALPAPAPVPAPLPVDESFIEDPAFHRMEESLSRMERPDRRKHPPDVENLSILDPQPAPESPDPMATARLAIAAIISVAIVVIVYLMK